MRCPHCQVAIHVTLKTEPLGKDVDGLWHASYANCPACRRMIIRLHLTPNAVPLNDIALKPKELLAYPRGSSRARAAKEVPGDCADDYNEACAVLNDSAKEAAALARRCLQHVLRDYAKVKAGDLFDEIGEALNSGKLPSHINSSLDSVRNVGNFASHPIKSKKTGELLDVEPGEAEWTLDTLEALFDYYFVAPANAKARADALNAKLQEGGKRPTRT